MKFSIPPAARWLALLCLLAVQSASSSQANAPPQDSAALAIVQQVASRELNAYRHHQYYFYLSEERSDRTNQHVWLEAVAETPHGKLRRLLKEDGEPLSPQRRQQEDARIAALAADPAKLEASTHSLEQDEEHAHSLFNSPASLYLYSMDNAAGTPEGMIKIDFRPNPTYQAPSYELRVLHALAGSILVERETLRLRQLDANIAEDVKFGWGILGEIQPGGSIHMVRTLAAGDDYKPVLLDLHMQGHMLLFHTLSRAQHLTHRGFVALAPNLPLADAGKMVLSATP
jgi:hypothetical protein